VGLDAGGAVVEDESVWIDERATYSWEQWEILRKRTLNSARVFGERIATVASALNAIEERLREFGVGPPDLPIEEEGEPPVPRLVNVPLRLPEAGNPTTVEELVRAPWRPMDEREALDGNRQYEFRYNSDGTTDYRELRPVPTVSVDHADFANRYASRWIDTNEFIREYTLRAEDTGYQTLLNDIQDNIEEARRNGNQLDISTDMRPDGSIVVTEREIQRTPIRGGILSHAPSYDFGYFPPSPYRTRPTTQGPYYVPLETPPAPSSMREVRELTGMLRPEPPIIPKSDRWLYAENLRRRELDAEEDVYRVREEGFNIGDVVRVNFVNDPYPDLSNEGIVVGIQNGGYGVRSEQTYFVLLRSNYGLRTTGTPPSFRNKMLSLVYRPTSEGAE